MTELSPRNGWGEYQRLVLAELERLNKNMINLENRFHEMTIQIALMKEENGKIKELQEEVNSLSRSLAAIQQGDVIQDAIIKYRNWIIGLVFTVLVALILPTIAILLGIT